MQNNVMRILAFGDIVGNSGVTTFSKSLRRIKAETGADFVVVNGENSSEKDGLDIISAEALLGAGADCVTGGNHTLTLSEIHRRLDESQYLLRPLNFPPLCPGNGATVLPAPMGYRVLVMNVSGQVFMASCDSPFYAVDRALKENEGKYDIAILDIHAEATSEKVALGIWTDGRVQCVFGTHTHIPTADEHILPGGTGYITDLGMCGVYENTVLGVKAEAVIERFTTGVRTRFDRGVPGTATLCGAVFDVDMTTKRCISVKRIKY